MTQTNERPDPAHRPQRCESNAKAMRPLRMRLAIVMIACVYPLVTMLIYLIAPFTQGWQIWHQTMLLTPATVLSIVFVINPLVFKYFGRYINAM
ncbi:hypothetical protein [Thalassospira marina]|nr:hypothetical protein [Thalassospira marina]